MKFSVLMSVYKNEKVDFFKEAMNSVLSQTVKPEEIVLIRDGEVYEELQTAIDEYIQKYPAIFTYIPLEKNGGLGNALRIGVEKARNELIARMDTDDISTPNRFEKQLGKFEEDPDLDMVGGDIFEFTVSPQEINSVRKVPSSHKEIVERLKTRSPFNHVTVMFKKSAVLKAGNYQDFYLFEDWYLWIRMYLNGCRFANVPENFCFVRVEGMANRRGGMKYYKSCKKLLKYMKKQSLINNFQYMKIKLIRFVGYVLIPNNLRAWCYKKFLRNNQHSGESKTTEKIVQEV